MISTVGPGDDKTRDANMFFLTCHDLKKITKIFTLYVNFINPTILELKIIADIVSL
jgi:hypothetical protein